MQQASIADIAFLMVATTLCYLSIMRIATVEQFLGIAGMVFGAYYVHKAQNKTPVPADLNTSTTVTTTNTNTAVEPELITNVK